jgi:hypothetical protein
MHPDLTLVVRLQVIDNRITELEQEISALPKHVREIERKLDSHKRKLEADRAALTANQSDRKRFEQEVQVHQQKISKLKDQMLDAKTNEQYRAFMKEIEYCEAEVRKAEDRILDMMGESEPLEKNVKAAEVALKAEQAQVDGEKREVEQRTGEDKKALEVLQAERKSVVEGITPGVYADYQRIRKARGGIAVAEAVDGRCSCCHMALRLQYYQDLKKNDQVMPCESCRRILYCTPPVELEAVTS